MTKSKLEEIQTLKAIEKKVFSLNAESFALITDVNVYNCYRDFFKNLLLGLKEQNKKVCFWKTPSGEEAKTSESYFSTLDFLLESGVQRNTHLIAVGGGALSDLSGFVASTCLRGISWSVIPTTLLSMIDASIGGKVGINSKFGKNLIGQFHLPDNIWIYEGFLKTLDEVQVQSGKGELLKYFFLSKDIQKKNLDLSALIYSCAQYKLDLTVKDLYESNERKKLNLGHSFGHAFEKIYGIPHGHAVFWGMIFKLLIFKEDSALANLEKWAKSIEYSPGVSPWHGKKLPIDDIFIFLGRDKKMKSAEEIDLIKIKDHSVCIESITLKILRKTVESKLEVVENYVFPSN